MSKDASNAGRKSRPAPSDYDAQARDLINGYIATLCGAKAIKRGLRKALDKLQLSAPSEQ